MDGEVAEVEAVEEVVGMIPVIRHHHIHQERSRRQVVLLLQDRKVGGLDFGLACLAARRRRTWQEIGAEGSQNILPRGLAGLVAATAGIAICGVLVRAGLLRGRVKVLGHPQDTRALDSDQLLDDNFLVGRLRKIYDIIFSRTASFKYITVPQDFFM